VRGLWSLVDEVSGAADVGECYAGRVYLDECSVLRPYFLHGRHRGDRYEGRRRVMETGSRVIPGANPTTVFNLVGPATVGVSSLSGMRLALALERELGESIAFWPFDGERASDAGLVVTEIFPRLYYLRSGEAPGAWADPTAFRRVIRSYQGQFGGTVSSEDEGDAVVAAAALRSLSEEAEVWSAPEAEPFAASMEGWIFGAVDN
jgi:hypothetical protein